MHRSLGAAVLTAAVLLPNSCSRSGLQPVHDSELEIRVVRGPLNPVQVEGEENAAPVAGARVVVRQLDGRQVRRVETDGGGGVIVPVTSGEYAIEVTRCPTGTMFSKGVQVTVGAGERAPVTLICDTGIR